VIALKKATAPEWLEQNQDSATATYLAAPAGHKPSPWRAAAILASLRAESHGKCIYCEVITDDASYSAVEHIQPKSVFPGRVLDWENLGLVCPRCNTNKRDYWTDDSRLQILNPYRDEVLAHLEFLGALVLASNDSSRGVNTIRQLKFDTRDDLVISKMKRIQELESRIRTWRGEQRPEFRELLAEDVRDAFSPVREFSATLRAFAESRGFPV
jgi:uncharacterized protein (TIGR02646 family)